MCRARPSRSSSARSRRCRSPSPATARSRAAGEALEAIRETAGPQLVSAEIFDRYEGKGVPEGRVSLAFRLEFQKPDRALTDAEVAGATDRVVQMLSDRFGGELR